MRRLVCTLLALTCAGITAQADVVTLKNGDRVTGTLSKISGGSLQLKSEILGDLTIPLKQVASFAAEKPVAVIVKGQQPQAAVPQGQIELESSGDWQLTESGKPRTIAADSVNEIVPAEAYQKAEEHRAKLWQDWTGSASLGYGLQRGNQQTNTFTTTIKIVRERPATPIFGPRWRTNFDLVTLLSNSAENNVFVNSHTLSTNVRPQYLFTEATFVFGLVQFDHISTQGLYWRQTYGGGFGRDVIKSSRTTFSLLGGVTYVHEKFLNGEWDDSADALIGEKFGYQLSNRVRLDHNFNFYPNLSDTGQYRFDTGTTLSAKLAGKFSLNTSIIDLYLSNPPTGDKKNSLTFTTGIGYTF